MKTFSSAKIEKVANGFVMSVFHTLNHETRYYKTSRELLKALENEIIEDGDSS